MAHVSRFKKRDSDRSGFSFFEREFVKDGVWKVHPEELDQPPPSKKSLGGEGELSAGPDFRPDSTFASISETDVPTEVDNPIVYITAAGGITPSVRPFMRISGSLGTVNITANPQITRGVEGQILALVCADSGVQLDHGTGLNMIASAGYLMRSGEISVFMYHTGGTVWDETSRFHP